MCLPWSAVTVDCPYPMLERLKLLAAAHGGTVEGTDFGAAVSVRILLPQEIVDKTIDKYLQAYKMLTGKEL